ncbi:MAG: helix-turn-helix domain-containing protein [Phenylobacterium sp.]
MDSPSFLDRSRLAGLLDLHADGVRRGFASITFETAAKDVQSRIGAAIRRRRRAVEITLSDLAGVCGVSFQQVQKYESGACSISASQLWNMACALQVPISYFYEPEVLVADA